MADIRYGCNFYGVRLFCGAVLALVALQSLAGCATATIEDAVPVASSDAAPVPGQRPETVVAENAAQPREGDVPELAGNTRKGNDTGTFPNLNVAPSVANDQLTDEEKKTKLAELNAARQSQAAGSKSTGTTTGKAQLRKLATTHAKQTLKEIEGD